MDVPYRTVHEGIKGFVRNKARPEGGMAEGYTLEETLGFCTEYMVEFQSTQRRVWDDKEEDRVVDEVPEREWEASEDGRKYSGMGSQLRCEQLYMYGCMAQVIHPTIYSLNGNTFIGFAFNVKMW